HPDALALTPQPAIAVDHGVAVAADGLPGGDLARADRADDLRAGDVLDTPVGPKRHVDPRYDAGTADHPAPQLQGPPPYPTPPPRGPSSLCRGPARDPRNAWAVSGGGRRQRKNLKASIRTKSL